MRLIIISVESIYIINVFKKRLFRYALYNLRLFADLTTVGRNKY